MSKIEKYVPLELGLSSDAPGWNSSSSSKNHHNSAVLVPSSDEDGGGEVKKSLSTTDSSSTTPSRHGPICWKCKGSGKVADNNSKSIINKKKNKEKRRKTENGSFIDNINNDSSSSTSCNDENQQKCNYYFKECTVCSGKGTLKQKQKEIISLNQPGMITRKRKCIPGWKANGPIAYGIQQMNEFMLLHYEKQLSLNNDYEQRTVVDDKLKYHPLKLLHDADCTLDFGEEDKEGVRVPKFSDIDPSYKLLYPWFPINSGEQVCTFILYFMYNLNSPFNGDSILLTQPFHTYHNNPSKKSYAI